MINKHKHLFDESTFTDDGIVTKVIAETDSSKHVLFSMKGGTEISEYTFTYYGFFSRSLSNKY